MIGEIRQNCTEASASVGLILATALPFAVIILLLQADESGNLPDLGPDSLCLLGKCEESLQLHFCIFEE